MRYAKKIVPVMLLFLVLAGFAGGARAAVGVADAAEVQALLKNEPAKTVVVDVRTPGEWSGGVIKGALLIPMRDVPANLAKIPKDKKIVVVCAVGARSGAVASYLDKAGYPWVKNYAGGMSDWQRRGLPVVGP